MTARDPLKPAAPPQAGEPGTVAVTVGEGPAQATYRPDLEITERIRRTHQRIEVTQKQFDIINSKLSALLAMKQDLEERLQRAHDALADLEKQRLEVNAGLN